MPGAKDPAESERRGRDDNEYQQRCHALPAARKWTATNSMSQSWRAAVAAVDSQTALRAALAASDNRLRMCVHSRGARNTKFDVPP